MGKLVVSEFVTLDGVFQDPGGQGEFGRGGWAFEVERGPDGARFKLDELRAAEALLLGRVTYEGFARAWPSRDGSDEFALKMNTMPKYVVSTTLEHASWNNTTIIGGDLPVEVGRLKRELEGDLLVAGSAQLVHGLLDAGLVDELRLIVYPFLLGAGRRLFADARATTGLRLRTSKQDGDCLLLVYETLVPAADELGGASG
jgi:dihydrofolate reductase